MVSRGEKFDHFETVRMTKDGRKLDISLTVSPIRGSGGEIVGASTIARDITEQKRAEETLREMREAERRRIARDLHDGVLQDLAYAVQALEVTRLNAAGTALEEELQEEADTARAAVQGLRAAVNDLRLGDELDRPFPALVESLVDRNRAMARGYETGLEVEEGFPATSFGEAGTELLRIIQEALTNARRHSEARNVVVTLRIEGEDLVSEVADDGRGFAPGTTPGVGLRSMRERAEALGGRVEVESRVEGGTTVRLRVPVPGKGQ
jgi:signal transduction histidine kinase